MENRGFHASTALVLLPICFLTFYTDVGVRVLDGVSFSIRRIGCKSLHTSNNFFFNLMRYLDGLDFQVELTSFHGILSIGGLFAFDFAD